MNISVEMMLGSSKDQKTSELLFASAIRLVCHDDFGRHAERIITHFIGNTSINVAQILSATFALNCIKHEFRGASIEFTTTKYLAKLLSVLQVEENDTSEIAQLKNKCRILNIVNIKVGSLSALSNLYYLAVESAKNQSNTDTGTRLLNDK